MHTALPCPTRRRSLLAGLALAGAALQPALAAGPQRLPWPAGRATPPLRLPSLGGADWSLADARGQPVLLNFWASWCEPCRAEMPSLARLAAQHAAAGLQVVAVNFREGEATIERFNSHTPVGLPILRDGDGAAARAFGVRIFPATVAIDRRGRALFSVIGEADWQASPAAGWVASLL